MNEIQVSLVASANRPVLRGGFQNWVRFLNSLKENTINYEVIFVGDVKPSFNMLKYPEFKHIYATVKPAQAYEIGFRHAKGELVHWTADDADYNHPTRNCPTALDIAYERWVSMERTYGNKKDSVVAMRPIEDGGDVFKFHHFFGGWEETAVMAPFGLVSREKFHELGGYDSRFVSGQSENDVVMRFLEIGGHVDVCMEAFLYVHHRQVHPRTLDGSREDNKFREWYNTDRLVLENQWVIGGHGFYEKLNAEGNNALARKTVQISPTRLSPVERFEDKDICTITQGKYKGRWA